MGSSPTYNDALLNSLLEVYEKNPDDLNFKKYFALELLKRGELRAAYLLLLEVAELDQDLNVAKAFGDLLKLKTICAKLSS
jgi:hypothetical protein